MHRRERSLACALSDFMNDLEEKINYCFNDKQYLELALTHCSYAAEHGVKHNQRLEFLGDAVLEHVISKYIFDNNKLLVESESPIANVQNYSGSLDDIIKISEDLTLEDRINISFYNSKAIEKCLLN